MLLLVTATAGALVGIGFLLIVRGALGPVPSLALFTAELHRPRTATDLTPVPWTSRLLIWSAGGRAAQHRADLAICERSPAKFAQDRFTWTVLGAAPGLALVALAPSGIVSVIPFPVGLVAMVVGGCAGWFYSLIDLHADAERRRREFRHALAAYLELITILMAGGAGVESALYDAAAIGHGSAFRHLRTALSAARMRRDTPWEALGVLGERLGVDELVELRSSMTLAGDGARVRHSLQAKADTVRAKDRAAQEADAEKRSETMVLPVAMMFAGFLLLLGYPALAGLAGT